MHSYTTMYQYKLRLQDKYDRKPIKKQLSNAVTKQFSNTTI